MREEDLIFFAREFFSKGKASRELSEGIGDDCAVAAFDRRRDLILTCDTLTEGTHFLKGVPPEKLAHKLLAVNLSDIAAMAGSPWLALLSLSSPKTFSKGFWERFFRALGNEAERYGLAVAGGDCVAGEKLTLTLTMLGFVPKGKAVLRSGARKGDYVLVTGRLGGTLKSGKHLAFEPRLEEARYLREKLSPSAMMDLSDGLFEDGRKLALASSLTMKIKGDLVPLNPGCGLKEAMTGGEDFELLLTVPPENWNERIRKNFQRKFKLDLTPLGFMDARGKEPLLVDGSVRSWRGYAHFGI